MWFFLSRAFVKKRHIVTFAGSTAWVCQPVHAALLRPVQGRQRCMASASQSSGMSAVALDVCNGSLRIVAGAGLTVVAVSAAPATRFAFT